MARRFVPSIIVVLVACSDPAGPQRSAQVPSRGFQTISFLHLGIGDTLIIDQHSVGCFMVSDAHLVFLGATEWRHCFWSGNRIEPERACTIPLSDTVGVEWPREPARPIPARGTSRSLF